MRRTWSLAFPALLLFWPIQLAGQITRNHAADSTMQAGLVILDQARNGNGREFDRARGIFRRAHEQAPEWGAPLYGIGLAEGGKGDWLVAEPLNLGTRIGHGAYRAAIHALIAATEKDPGMTAAIIELDRVAGELRDTSVNSMVLAAVRRSVERGNTDPATLLVLGRRERAAGQTGASIETLQHFLTRSSNSSLAHFEIARSLLTEGRGPGDSLYFASARSGDSATIAELRADLVPIAKGDELAEFDARQGGELENFLRRFWNDRAGRDLRTPAERLAEHYRRLRYAREQFSLSNNRRYHGQRDLYRAPKTETLDDRGVVYVRHGEPDQRLRPLLFGLLPNETWRYHRADGDLLLHFSSGGEGVEGGDLTDYRLVPSVFDLRGNRMPRDMLIASRFEASEIYEKIMSWGPHGAARMTREEREWGERSAAVGTGTDGFELTFSRPLETRSDLVAIGQRNGSALVQVIYHLPDIEPGLPVRVRLALFDSLGAVHAWLDSTASSQPMSEAGSGGRFEVSSPAGRWTYRLALEAGNAGLVTPRAPIVVPALDQGRLTLSDIAMGRRAGNLDWIVTPADTALVSPYREFPADGELRLYYEVYGLQAGSLYSSTIKVLEKRREGTGRSRLRFNFEEEAGEDITRIRRSIFLGGLPVGEYWLEVIVREKTGRQVTARKSFSIISVTH